MEAIAIHDFIADTPEELSFKKNQILKILNMHEDTNWYNAELESREGLVPNTYIEMKNYDWYTGRMSKAEVMNQLMKKHEGAFFMRVSESSPGDFSLSVRYPERVKHFKVIRDSKGKYFLFDVKKFDSLNKLVDYHRKRPLTQNHDIKLCDEPPENHAIQVVNYVNESRPGRDIRSRLIHSTATAEENMQINIDLLPNKMSREEAERQLINKFEGAFLIRESNGGSPGDISLSVRCTDRVHHFKVLREPKTKNFKWIIQFKSLNDFVTYHRTTSVVPFQNILLINPYPEISSMNDDMHRFGAESDAKMERNYANSKHHDWITERITRADAESLLITKFEGAFLIRVSESSPRDVSLSVRCSDGVQHFKLLYNPSGNNFLWHVKFAYLNDLIKYLHTTSLLPYQNIKLRNAFPEIPSIRDDMNAACGPSDLLMGSREDLLHNEYVAMRSYEGM